MKQFELFEGFYNSTNINNLSRGITIIAGSAGSGKTSLLYSAAVMAKESDNKVLYISNEPITKKITKNFYIISSLNSWFDITELKTKIKEIQPDVIFIDDAEEFMLIKKDTSKIFERIVLLEKTNKAKVVTYGNDADYFSRKYLIGNTLKLMNIQCQKGIWPPIFLGIQTIRNGSFGVSSFLHIPDMIIEIGINRVTNNRYVKIRKNRSGLHSGEIPVTINKMCVSAVM